MSEAVLRELAQVLEEQVGVYQELLEIAIKKEDILRLADVEALEQVVKVEQGLILQGGELEKRRFTLQQALAAARGVPVEDMTLEKLAQGAEDPTVALCLNTGEKLAHIIKELEERNERCARVINEALSLVKKTVENTAGRKNLVDRLV